MIDDENIEMEVAFFSTHKMYTEYFSALNVQGIASFIANSEGVLGGFDTSLENFEKQKKLFEVHRKAIVTALLEHPAAEQLKDDMSVLAKIVGVDLSLKNN